MSKCLSRAAVVITFTAQSVGLAADEGPVQPDANGPESSVPSTYVLRGLVNSVNPSAGRVSITHEPVESLKWPKIRMKINYRVHDPTVLDGIHAGMMVDFEIRKMGDEYHLTRIAPTK